MFQYVEQEDRRRPMTVGWMLEQVDACSNRLEHAELDTVVYQFREMAGP